MEAEHVIVYRQAGRYAGWPANYGIWAWEDEIVVGFTVGYPRPEERFHARDRGRPFETMQARSLDGGHTWQAEPMPVSSPGGRALSADEHMLAELGVARALDEGHAPQPEAPAEPIDFSTPGLALMCARTGLGAGARSWFYVSYDRCRHWAGPYALPMFGQAGIEARTDYVLSDEGECTLFLTASKDDGGEGKGVFAARTEDGGRSFSLRSWVAKADSGIIIMPSTVCVSDGTLLTALRCHEDVQTDGGLHYIDLYRSADDAQSWQYHSRPVPNTGRGGNPPALVALQDGRLCLTYGYRAEPYGMRARLSDDGGATWSDELILRDDGGSPDLGYPRTVQRPDGTMVAVYYFNDRPGGAAYLAATLWRP